ncbi:MAG TPA: hypothetical protein VM097_08280 [Mycobacteriales bacterium]|nr:hypothetical protein [Mycobacteriales bacterium]
MRRFVVPLLLVPVVSLVLAAFRPQILTAGFMSWRAFAVTAGVGVAGLLVLAALWRRSRLLAVWTADLVVLALMASVVWPVFRERTVDEAFPPVAVVTPSASSSPEAPTATARTAVLLASGRLSGIDHHAQGRIGLYDVGGEVRLRFESVDIEGTPTPSVHLVSQGKRTPGGGTRLGGLKGEKGSFSYAVPVGLDVTQQWSVLVWCDRYAVPIAASDLRA